MLALRLGRISVLQNGVITKLCAVDRRRDMVLEVLPLEPQCMLTSWPSLPSVGVLRCERRALTHGLAQTRRCRSHRRPVRLC